MLAKGKGVSLLSVAIALMITAVSVMGFVLASKTAAEQNQRLLADETAQGALIAANTFSGYVSEVTNPLVAVAELVPAAIQPTVSRVAAAEVSAKLGVDVFVRSGNSFVAEAAAGPSQHVGLLATGSLRATLQEALSAPFPTGAIASDFVPAPVVSEGNSSTVGFAEALPDSKTVLYFRFTLDPYTFASQLVETHGPFELLRAVLYGSTRADTSRIVVATSRSLPLEGLVASKEFSVGTHHWLLVTQARSPLAGSFSALAPWVILGLGLFLALLLAWTVEVLVRRQRYANRLVAERTAALEVSVSDLRNAQDRLVSSEERFRTLAGAAPIGILEVASGSAVTYANARTAEISGRCIESLMGTQWIDAVHPDDALEVLALIDRVRPDGESISTRFRLQRPDGEVRHVRLLGSPRGHHVGSGYVVTIQDISEEVQAEEALTHLAFYDALTGLPNRALFLDRLNQDLARYRREKPEIAVLFLDLDRFKIVNDSLGHEAGDAVLKEVGDRFRAAVREGETAARFSGDEFIFIIRGVHEIRDSVTAAKRLLAQLEEPIQSVGQGLTVTGSVGIVIPAGGADAGTILRDADTAMYHAKEAGRNTYALFDENLHLRSVERLAIESELRQALANQEFEVYYQPVVDPANGRPHGAEALIRWHHPTRGLVSPLEFIPVAEDSGLIQAIGRWVFDRAISQVASWDVADNGPRLNVLAVNVSARQLDDAETSGVFRDVLTCYGVAANRVLVEVTESVIMANRTSTRRTLHDFNDLGLNVAIDDFGTGYSSLAYLHTLPVSTLKIDRSFIERLGTEDDSTPIVQAIIEMSHAMGLRVVAEGVSSARIDALVSAVGCDSVQGFFWAQPMPAGEFVDWWLEAEGRAVGPSGGPPLQHTGRARTGTHDADQRLLLPPLSA